MRQLTVFKLGLTSYDEALSFQFELVERVRESKGRNSFLMLLEHQPVITLGKNANGHNILASPESLKKQGIQVKTLDRGGDVTYHGPGQLVGYPIIQMAYHKKTLRAYVRLLEQALIQTLAGFDVEAKAGENGSAGIWVGGSKIGFIGMRVSQGVTYHGFSFNVNNELDAFGLINPCGMKNPQITSLAKLLGRPVSISEVTAKYLESFRVLFDVDITEVKTHLSYIPKEIPL
jgi:lipoate-protein ligase B